MPKTKPEILTSRLRLRSWRDEDLPAYAALNADPKVRRWWPAGVLTREQSDAEANFLQDHIERYGFGFWAVEIEGVAPFIGFVGLQHVTRDLPFAPAIEAGWRLARPYWGRGYATEAARSAVAHGFEKLGFSEIVSYAFAGNWPSRRVMERIGMRHDPSEDFDHPDHRGGDPLWRYVVYRVAKSMPPIMTQRAG